MDGEQVLADTGVYDYGGNERRQHARSVEAHNTAQYADAEPIPIGGSYLMGKRTSVDVLERGPRGIKAQYSRDTMIGPQYEHRRKVVATQSGWDVTDCVRSDETDEFTIRYHFHPSIDVRETDDSGHEFVVYRGESELGRFRFTGGTKHRLVHTLHFERFGRERDRLSIKVTSATGTEVLTIVVFAIIFSLQFRNC